ncbi:MAG: hypothetical protein NTV34_16600, partial [Proteobacteria bacterium]|nr:hypothetical protein [Pseudomonadota bacterium]
MMYKLYSISIFIFIVSGCRTTQSGVKDLGDTDGIVIERNKSYGSEGYKVTCDFGLRGKIVRAVVWKEE